jgi:hypothetical protein
LGRDPSLLDRELGQIPGGVDVGQPEYPAELVGWDEAMLVLRNTSERPPLEHGQRDDRVRFDVLVLDEADAPESEKL